MTKGNFALLPDRGLLTVGGPEAEHFLQNLVTCEVETLVVGEAAFGALLTPQGKILFDFLIYRTDKGFLLDAPLDVLADLKKRLGFYKLRAKVEIGEAESDLVISAVWDLSGPRRSGLESEAAFVVQDPRVPNLGLRMIAPSDLHSTITRELDLQGTDAAAWHAHRISLGVPEGGRDFAYSDIFPHDADMDQLGGISFKKGCYIGQEIVSRMEHRGTARKRFVVVTAATPLPEAGTIVTADNKSIGELGSSDGIKGLALLRLDKAKAALDNGSPIKCGDAKLEVRLPDWATFGWPE